MTGSLPAHEVLPQGRTPVLQGGEASIFSLPSGKGERPKINPVNPIGQEIHKVPVLIKEFLAALLRGQSASVASFLWSPELALGSIPFDYSKRAQIYDAVYRIGIEEDEALERN
jgi:hypothetical protein